MHRWRRAPRLAERHCAVGEEAAPGDGEPEVADAQALQRLDVLRPARAAQEGQGVLWRQALHVTQSASAVFAAFTPLLALGPSHRQSNAQTCR